jgi:hypothetical protein
MVTAWGSLVVDTSLFSPGGSGTGSGTVQVLDATSGQQLASATLDTSGTTTVGLASVAAASHPTIRVVFTLQSSGQATPLVHSFAVSYTTQVASSLTLVASPVKVVFGKAVKLSGLLSAGGAALAGQSVVLSSQPFGASGFTQLATLTTSSAGAYATTSKPKKQTAYQAGATGVAVPPTVTVKVAQRVTLSVRRKGGKVYVKGSLGPKKRRRLIVIQVRAGKHWKKLARVRTTKRSTFKVVRVLQRGHAYKFRATTRGYPGLLSGTSRTVRLRR